MYSQMHFSFWDAFTSKLFKHWFQLFMRCESSCLRNECSIKACSLRISVLYQNIKKSSWRWLLFLFFSYWLNSSLWFLDFVLAFLYTFDHAFRPAIRLLGIILAILLEIRFTDTPAFFLTLQDASMKILLSWLLFLALSKNCWQYARWDRTFLLFISGNLIAVFRFGFRFQFS